MKVLVTGCARSGTTLMVHLMQYFGHTQVMLDKEEHPNDYLIYNDKDHILVIKKPMIERKSVEYFPLRLLIDMGWKIIWMLRDGRDVLTSTHLGQKGYVGQTRWVNTNYEMLKNFDSENILIVRYENLVTNPKSQMDRIKDFLQMDYRDDFMMFYETMVPGTSMVGGIIPRPIDSNSIGQYKEHQFTLSDKFKKLLTIFGYE